MYLIEKTEKALYSDFIAGLDVFTIQKCVQGDVAHIVPSPSLHGHVNRNVWFAIMFTDIGPHINNWQQIVFALRIRR